ncbi:MAG: pyridoxamine 5'-phosphate oxidase family protein [Chthoniobacterales bacterium]
MEKSPLFVQPCGVLDAAAEPSFDMEDSEDFIGLAEQLMDGHHAGILTTVDEKYRPHSRWMGTMSFREFPRFHAITSPQSAKVRHIERQPHVEWMLSNQDLTLVLNLSGVAHILRDAASIKRTWKAIGDKSHAFFLNSFNEKPGFVVIETTVERIECTVPRSNIKWPTSVETFRRRLLEPVTTVPGLATRQVSAANPLPPAEMLKVDEGLCQQAEQLATGADIHECSNLTGAYRAAVAQYNNGDAAMRAVVKSVERSLRRMLTKLRLDHYSRLRIGER